MIVREPTSRSPSIRIPGTVVPPYSSGPTATGTIGSRLIC